jgi:hypothetical protein
VDERETFSIKDASAALEVKMCDTGVFSLKTASGLSNIIFFHNGKTFGFCGMEQHTSCAAEQFSDYVSNRQHKPAIIWVSLLGG